MWYLGIKRQYCAELNALGKEKRKLARELKRLSKEYESARDAASSNEEGMFEEKIRQTAVARNGEKETDAELLGRIRRYEMEKGWEEKQKTRHAGFRR